MLVHRCGLRAKDIGPNIPVLRIGKDVIAGMIIGRRIRSQTLFREATIQFRAEGADITEGLLLRVF